MSQVPLLLPADMEQICSEHRTRRGWHGGQGSRMALLKHSPLCVLEAQIEAPDSHCVHEHPAAGSDLPEVVTRAGRG